MATESEPQPNCSLCGEQMTLRSRGTDPGIPVLGSEIEYQQFACPNCGQGARYERSDPDGEWARAGT